MAKQHISTILLPGAKLNVRILPNDKRTLELIEMTVRQQEAILAQQKKPFKNLTITI